MTTVPMAKYDWKMANTMVVLWSRFPFVGPWNDLTTMPMIPFVPIGGMHRGCTGNHR